jgi:lipopolysaccharide export system protein LptA
MTARRRALGSLGLALLATACGRGRPPAPPPSPVDTLATVQRPAVTDTTERERAPQPQPVTTAVDSAARKPPAPGASNKRCLLDLENTPETRMFTRADSGNRNRVTFLGGGLFGKCRGQDITIIADSAESYEVGQLHILVGNVHYKEPKAAINAQRVTYYRADERLVFENNVLAEMPNSGGTMAGPRAEYFRQVTGLRARERLVATGRPTLTVIEKDSLGRPQPPVTMNANTIVADGDSTFFGSGQVMIVRTDLIARGDSVMMDGKKKYSRLLRQPIIESKGSQPYTLRGRVIDMYGGAKAVDRVIALDSATAVSKDLELASDTIDLRVKSNKLERAFAFGPAGATATTPGRTVIADSLDVLMPDQRVREMRAIGKAYVESDPDSTKIKSDERDWLRGDTVIATFDSLAANDTTSRPPMRTVIATGKASALYQVPPQRGDTTKARPAPGKPGINYTRGRIIRLDFAKGEVETVTVTDKASGVYLEPGADSTSVRRAPIRAAPPRRPPRGSR